MTQADIYRHHHGENRERGFSILKEERGELIANLVGTGKDILDLGCRDGALTRFFTEDNKVLGVDVDPVALGRASNLGIETMAMDINGEWHELSSRQFDAVVAGEVLEHLYFPERVAAKVSKVLRPGGVFVGSVPNAFSLKNRLRILFGIKKGTPLSDPTHINQFHAQELESILKKHFARVEVLGLGRYHRLAKLSSNLFAFDLFFIARK